MNNLIFRTQFGSHIYGTNVETSDQDFRGIALPSSRDIILQRAFKTQQLATKQNDLLKNTKDDIDSETYSLHYWLKLFIEGQTLCYDMLFTPSKFWLQTTPYWTELYNNRDKLLNSKISSFAGYCQAQASKYSLKGSNLAAYRLAKDFFVKQPSLTRLSQIRDNIIEELINVSIHDQKYHEKGEPLIKFVTIPHRVTGVVEEYIQVGPKIKVPMNASCKIAYDTYLTQFERYGERAKQAETNQGIDWKALMHAVRVCQEAEELLLTGNITLPRPEAELLLKIRKGELPYREVADIIVGGLDKLNDAKTKTVLPSEPDHKWIEDFIYNTYKEQI